MTFKKFEELFKTKYADGMVCQHGKFGGTEHNNKVAVCFNEYGKVYEYYGAYEDILCRLGIKVISKSRLREHEIMLERYRSMHGGKSFNLFSNEPVDYSKQIAEYENKIAEIKANYIVV